MILSLINYKGGVGKTTSTVNIGAGLARRGKSVLLVDTDPQANLTAIAGLRNDPAHTLYDLMHHKCDIAEAIRPATATTLGCAVIPASEELNKIPRELADELGKESILRDWLQSVKAEFDFILLDCCPSRNLLSDNALAAAHEAYIPVQAEHLATQGLGQIAERVQEMRRKRVNTTLHITGIIPTMYKTSQKSC
ncbi:MAG: ParA family protein, partial [Bacteroidetes bacterium]